MLESLILCKTPVCSQYLRREIHQRTNNGMEVQLYTWKVQTLIQTFLQTIFSSGKRFVYSYLETMNFSVICMGFQEPKVTKVIINRNMFMCTVLDTHRHTYLHLPTPHTDTLIYTHTHTHLKGDIHVFGAPYHQMS